MKTTIEALKRKVNEVREEILSSIECRDGVFSDNEEQYLNELFEHVSSETDLETYIWESADLFVSNYISAEDVFLARKNRHISNMISEVLSERDNCLDSDSVSAIDDILEQAVFRYMIMVASNVEEELLKVYILDNLFNTLLDYDNDLELDASEYGDYEEEESLLDDFIDELLSTISSNTKIINIEDNHTDTLNEFFQLEV